MNIYPVYVPVVFVETIHLDTAIEGVNKVAHSLTSDSFGACTTVVSSKPNVLDMNRANTVVRKLAPG